MSLTIGAEKTLQTQAVKLLTSDAQERGIAYLTGNTKRRLDVALGGVLSAGALPLIALLGTAVFAQDGHNPFLEMRRLNPATKQRIPIWKIRSMIPNASAREAEVVGSKSLAEFKSGGSDSRVTPFGRLIRKGSADELPQLLLATRGDISLVGPRMFSDTEWDKHVLPYAKNNPYQELLEQLALGVKFGVTGLYGIFGRANLPIPERIALEAIYCREANLIGDLRIIAQTVAAVVSTRGAY